MLLIVLSRRKRLERGIKRKKRWQEWDVRSKRRMGSDVLKGFWIQGNQGGRNDLE